MDGQKRTQLAGMIALCVALCVAVVAGDAVAQSSNAALPLGVAAESSPIPSPSAAEAQSGGLGDWIRVAAGLGVVIGVILVTAAGAKRLSSRAGLAGELGAGGRAPSGVLDVLGRYPVSRGQTLVLIRMGGRVLLLSQHTSAGFRTLTEVDDPEEIGDLIHRASRDEERTKAEKFKGLLSGFERSFDRSAASTGTPDGTAARASARRVSVNAEGDRAELLATPQNDESGSLGRLLAKLGGDASERTAP